MPEEHNRRVTDHLSKHLFAPTESAGNNLRKENCWGTTYVTGNTVIDSCIRYGPRAVQDSHILNTVPFQQFALATAHRAENVDNVGFLREFSEVLTKCPVPVVYPIHPRTRARFLAAHLLRKLESSGNVSVIRAIGYLDFLALLMKCEFVLTDSGGVQEEVTAPNIDKKAFILRNSTERPETVESGHAEVVGTHSVGVLANINRFLKEDRAPRKSSPFGDGHAGERIVDILQKRQETKGQRTR